MTPDGIISEIVKEHGKLAHDYHKYLMAVEPKDKWGDIGLLAEPIPPVDEYPVDWELLRRWAARCPPLAGVICTAHDYDIMGPLVGWNYAWTRFPQHLYLLDVIEQLEIEDGWSPSLVLEPGCFTGGLLHFLADHWRGAACAGFDLSPVSLDVCGYYCEQTAHANRPHWFEADSSQIHPEQIPEGIGQFVDGGLVILSNVIENLAKSFERYPYIDPWFGKAKLISFWVNHGATVLLAERHENPEALRDTLVECGD